MEKPSELTQLLVSLSKLLEVGRPIGHRNLTLVPLFGQSAPLEYTLAADAIADGTLCRHIGTLTPTQFRKAQKKVCGGPDFMLDRLRGMFCFESCETDRVPLVCLGRLEKEI